MGAAGAVATDGTGVTFVVAQNIFYTLDVDLPPISSH
jgi:hypothetical protein